MKPRRLNDRIRELCARAVSVSDTEVEAVLEDLRVALAEHTRRLRKIAAQKLVGDGEPQEKRSR